MAYKQYQSFRSGEQITMEDFHEDFKVYNNIVVIGDKALLQTYSEILLDKWFILIEDTPYIEELKNLDLKAEKEDNPVALSKGIINILRRAGAGAGFYGKQFVDKNKPVKLKNAGT